MGDFEFGSQEHIDGLSRNALEADFRFVVDRMREAEGEWERLKAENEKLRELAHDFALFAEDAVNKYGIELEAGHDVEAPPAEWKECLYELEMLANRMRDLGIEVTP